MSAKNVDEVAEKIYDGMLEKILTEIVLQIKIEEQFEHSVQSELEKFLKKYQNAKNVDDIFYNCNSKDTNECICPNCKRTLGAIRFAPHLEKCVGMGRSSSRIASRRILANSSNGKEVRYNEEFSESTGSSQQSNGDWTPAKSSKRNDCKKKRDRNGKFSSCRNKKKEGNSSLDNTEDLQYNNMNYEQRQNTLSLMCGVVSEHTGRLCTRSIRCPKHTEEQRNSVRSTVLNNGSGMQTDFSKMNMTDKL